MYIKKFTVTKFETAFNFNVAVVRENYGIFSRSSRQEEKMLTQIATIIIDINNLPHIQPLDLYQFPNKDQCSPCRRHQPRIRRRQVVQLLQQRRISLLPPCRSPPPHMTPVERSRGVFLVREWLQLQLRRPPRTSKPCNHTCIYVYNN